MEEEWGRTGVGGVEEAWQRVHLLCVGAVGSVDKGKADLVAGQGQAGEAELQRVPTTDRFGSSEL